MENKTYLKQQPITGNNNEEQALYQLNQGHYKEAIVLYKQLWLDTNQDQWKEKLAYCYLQRAKSFVDRGMFREAIGLWENYIEYCEPPYQDYDHYLYCLIEGKHYDKLAVALQQLTARQLDENYPQLAALLGLLLITECPELQFNLPKDSALLEHFKIVQTALHAFQDGQSTNCQQFLKQLPYRSAYRDLRILLNAVNLLPADMEQAKKLLMRIADNSPYVEVAKLIIACTCNGRELLLNLSQFNYQQQQLVMKAKGFDFKQKELLEYLCAHTGLLSDKQKFKLAIKCQSLLSTEKAQVFCLSMLAGYPAGYREFKKHFTTASEFEINRINALRCERENNTDKAEVYWQQCIELLKQEDEEGNALKVALVLRHIAAFYQSVDDQIDLLVESLRYDPEDLPIYMQILTYYGQHHEFHEDYKQWLQKALGRFPVNMELLALAVNVAASYKACEEVFQYAEKILTQDSLNSFAKQALLAARLDYARQLILTKQYPQAEQQIQQAEKLSFGKAFNSQVQLIKGLLELAGGKKERGMSFFVDGLNCLYENPINRRFQAAMELQSAGLSLDNVLQAVPLTIETLPTHKALFELVGQIKQYASYDNFQNYLFNALAIIKPDLQESLQCLQPEENLWLSLSELFCELQCFECLRYCTMQLPPKSDKPVWAYYRLYAELDGAPEQCSRNNISLLRQKRDQAKQNNDYRAMMLMDDFLHRYHQVHPERKKGVMGVLLGRSEQTEEEYVPDHPLKTLFAHIPEKLLMELENKSDDLSRTLSPEQLVQDLSSTTIDQHTMLMAMMKTPDLFTAMLILRVADKQGVDVHVGIDDVIDVFKLEKHVSGDSM